MIGFAHEIPLRGRWSVTAKAISTKSINDVDGSSLANLCSISGHVEFEEFPMLSGVAIGEDGAILHGTRFLTVPLQDCDPVTTGLESSPQVRTCHSGNQNGGFVREV